MKFFQKLGSHYAIERFGVLFLSLSVMMALLLTSIGINKVRMDANLLSGMAVYTNSFSMSKSGVSGSVRGVYTSTDKHDVFLLLEFTDTLLMSLDVNDYQLFLTGSDSTMHQAKLKSNPDGTLYMFGNTGYVGVHLYNSEPFPSQIMSLVIRDNSQWNDTGVTESGASDEDATFTQYNQGRIYFNPGGTYAPISETLDKVDLAAGQDIDVSALYEEIVVRPSEKAIRTTLRQDLLQMLKHRESMQEYATRLEKNGLSKPVMPLQISGDKFVGINPDNPDMELGYSIKNGMWYGEDSVAYPMDSVHLFLNCTYVAPGGSDYDWQLTKIKDGYLKGITNSDKLSDWDKYFDEKQKLMTPDKTFTTDIEFTYKNGSPYVGEIIGSEASATNKKLTTINQEILTLQQNWNDYYTLKVQYQTVDLPALLYLESEIRQVAENHSIKDNADKNLLFIY